MFILTNIYFRPYEFVAVYQRIECMNFMSFPGLVYIQMVNREPK